MRNKSLWKAALSLLWRGIRNSLILFACTFVIFWFFSEHSLLELSNYLFLGGAISILFGLILLAGGWGSTKSFSYQYGSSAGPDDLRERARHTFLDLLALYDLTAQIWLAGTILILLSILAGQLL
ncbi:MAG: hypothetical protein P1P76_00810 [Anaerolineales bacterium]|nr:hypothetical protein [Anaerolineales bacterium]